MCPKRLGEAKRKRKSGTFLRNLYEGTGGRWDRYSILCIIIEIGKQQLVATGKGLAARLHCV
jgi:hypothetical protein